MAGEREIDIRPYQPGDEAGILRSFNLVFREVCGPGYVDRDLAVWRWQFQANPWGHRISVAVAENGDIAAHYAAIPVPMATAFGDCLFVQGVDSFTHPAYRQGLKRPGLFVQTALHCLEACRARHESWYGFPVAAAERIGKRFLSYERVAVVDYLCRATTAPTPAATEVSVETTDSVPLDAERLCELVAPTRRCWIRRTVQYFDWRYATAPGAPYRFHAARRNGELCGLMVVRLVHELVPLACTIADWLAPPGDEETVTALVRAAHATANAHGRSLVLAVFPEWSEEHAALRRLGFQVTPSAQSMERPLTIGLNHPQMSIPWLAQHWWYTLGDTDLV